MTCKKKLYLIIRLHNYHRPRHKHLTVRIAILGTSNVIFTLNTTVFNYESKCSNPEFWHKKYIIFIHVAPVVTVIGIASPMGFKLVVAGKLFSITCMVNGADDLQARFNFTLIAEGNGTVIHHEEESSDTELIHNFTARASDAGMYICKVTVTSSFLDKPIISNTTLTLTVQSKPNLCDQIKEKNS